MRSCDVVAWAFPGGYLVCPDCLDPAEVDADPDGNGAPAAVFADSEWDSLPSCDRCREPITDVGLTPEGVAFHADELSLAGGTMAPEEARERSGRYAASLRALQGHGVPVEESVLPAGDGLVTLRYVFGSPAGRSRAC